MIIVSNTSPITNLAAIGQFELLHCLYGSIHIADAVWNELHADEYEWPGAVETASAGWIIRHSVSNRPLESYAWVRYKKKFSFSYPSNRARQS